MVGKVGKCQCIDCGGRMCVAHPSGEGLHTDNGLVGELFLGHFSSTCEKYFEEEKCLESGCRDVYTVLRDMHLQLSKNFRDHGGAMSGGGSCRLDIKCPAILTVIALCNAQTNVCVTRFASISSSMLVYVAYI